jgi:DNA-binding response OmpR family regulator
MAKILVIDDEPLVRKTIEVVLARAGHHITEAQDGIVGASVFEDDSFDIVITDMLMPEQDGIETIRRLRGIRPTVKILAISGGGRNPGSYYLTVARKLGADEILQKPFDPAQLLAIVSALA